MKLPGIRLITQSQLGRFFQNVTTINFRDWFFSLRKNICRIASMFIITRAVSTPRDVERRERGSMFCKTLCFSLDIRLFTYISSCSLSHSSRRLLSILVSSLTFLHVFLDSLYTLLFSVALSLSFYFHSKPSLHELEV